MASVNAFVSDHVTGVQSIRTFRTGDLATEECMREMDEHQKHFFMEMVSDCWLFVRLQMVTGVFLASLGGVIVLWR